MHIKQLLQPDRHVRAILRTTIHNLVAAFHIRMVILYPKDGSTPVISPALYQILGLGPEGAIPDWITEIWRTAAAYRARSLDHQGNAVSPNARLAYTLPS